MDYISFSSNCSHIIPTLFLLQFILTPLFYKDRVIIYWDSPCLVYSIHPSLLLFLNNSPWLFISVTAARILFSKKAKFRFIFFHLEYSLQYSHREKTPGLWNMSWYSWGALWRKIRHNYKYEMSELPVRGQGAWGALTSACCLLWGFSPTHLCHRAERVDLTVTCVMGLNGWISRRSYKKRSLFIFNWDPIVSVKSNTMFPT